ncbi:MAG TPA: hypothetical protein DDZ04_08440 [Parabacteroides sp.]|nr:hypothetical protein [Parabacteroides sp.]
MKRLSLTFLLFAALSVTSCDVHEFPELPTENNFTLHLDFDTELPIYKKVVHAKSRAANDAEAYDVRHTVSIHRLYPDGNYDRTADTTIVFTCDDVKKLNCSKEFRLSEGTYNFFVWTDFVDEGSRNDKYYTTSDFNEIILKDKKNHAGCCDFRDAFRGMQQAAVTVRKDEMTKVNNEATVTMKRPLAKFKFISTDYAAFVENVLKAGALKKGTNGVNETGNGAESKSINPDDYRVVFRYIGFMPCSYNMFTDKPADSWTGVTFDGTLKPKENGEVEMGFDYVFVNGAEASVSVMVEVYHKDGNFVASSPTIDVPLKRSRLTIVRGSFLTSVSEGNIGIVPDFEGEYNIIIQ